MTAEVLAMNKVGAAMAADSKGTIRIDGVVKTHDTLSKLFTLSKYHPVGIMIYGNAETFGIPWETVIKLYRDRLRDRCFSSLSSYANDFAAGLKADYDLSFDTNNDNVHWVARDFANIIVDGAERFLNIGGTSMSPLDAVERSMIGFHEYVFETPVLFGFKDLSSDQILSEYSDHIRSAFQNSIAEQFFKQFEGRATALIAEALRRRIFSSGHSGIVLAGFGDKEIFPAAKSFQIDGCVAGRIRGAVLHRVKINNELTAAIRPFAQHEMVYRFMEGIDPAYRLYLERAFHRISEEISLSVINKYATGNKAKKLAAFKDVKVALDRSMEEFVEYSALYRKEKFADPIVKMAQLLPKEDLAHLAESFVNLTSLKRRVSLDDESVGGPIDVAVISKGDGFVWLKRKHYFDKDLNTTFGTNYFRNHVKQEGETGGERIKKATH